MSTIEELEDRMKELEGRYLGSTSSTGGGSALTPMSGHRSMVENFLKTHSDESSGKGEVSGKLPQVKLPEFDGQNLETFLKDFSRFLRLSGGNTMSEKLKLDWLIESITPKVKRLIEKLVEESDSRLEKVLRQMEALFPKIENDLTIRSAIEKIPQLPQNPDPAQVANLLLELESLFGKLSENAMSDQEKFLTLLKKLHPRTYGEIRADRFYKRRSETFSDLKATLVEKVGEDWVEKNLLKRENFLRPLMEKGAGKGEKDPENGEKKVAGKAGGKGVGKGGEKGSGKGKGRGRGAREKNFEDTPAPKFGATIYCKFCKKKGHYEDKCWSKEKYEKKKAQKGAGEAPPPLRGSERTQGAAANPE
jgi:hypothetical protein